MKIKTKVIPIFFILLLGPVNIIAGEWGNLTDEVINSYKAGQYSKAVVLAEQALNLSNKEFGSKHPNTLTSMNNLAEMYRLQGRFKKAEPIIVKTLVLLKEIRGLKHPHTLGTMNNLALLYKSLGRYIKAESLSIETLALKKEVLGLKHPDTLSSMNNLAELYRLQGQHQKAEPLHIATLDLRKEVLGLKHSATLASMNNLALTYNAQGHYEAAEPLLIETLNLTKDLRGSKHPNTLSSMNNLAELYQLKGLYNKAESLFTETLTLRKEVLGLKHPDTLDSMNNLALLYGFQGRYEKAEPIFIETLDLNKVAFGLQHPKTLTSTNNLAVLYKSQGRYEKAEPLLVETLASRKKVLGTKHPNSLQSLTNLASLYISQGRYEKVAPLYIETLSLKKEVLGLKHPDTLISMGQLAELYHLQGRYEKAESLLIETLSLKKEVLSLKHPSTLISMGQLASLYNSLGRYEKAESLLIETLSLKNEVLGFKHPSTLITMNNLAVFYYKQGRYEKVEQLYIETLGLQQEVLGFKHPDTLITMNNLAGLYHTKQQWKKAQSLWDEYLTLSNQFLTQVLWASGEKTRLSYIQQQDYKRNTILSFFSHLIANKSSKSLYISPFSDIDPELVGIQAWRVSISRKGLLLRVASEVSMLSKIHQSSDPQLTQLSEQIKQTRSQLATLTFSAKPNPKQLAKLEEQLNTLQRQLGAKVSSFRSKTETINPEQIISVLTEQQAVVDFLVFKEVDLETQEYKTDQVIALLADSKQGVQLIKLGPLAPISKLIQNYRNVIEPNTYADGLNSLKRQQTLTQTSKALYQKLWKPLVHAFQDKQQVFLIPDGILHLLPFKALQDDQGQYLSDQIQLTRLGSARDLVIPPVTSKATPTTIYANPVYAEKEKSLKTPNQKNRTVSRNLRGLKFSPLPGTKTESESIQKTLQHMQQPVNLYTQLKATETAIRNEKSPRILHIATHGFFLENIKVPENIAKTGRIRFSGSGKAAIANVENPLTRSGLALAYANQGISGKKQADGSDGILTALEVLNLQLEGTELVTLSACETGVGEISVGEGVYSLNRAFQEAGAKAVLSTLWSISDEGTNHFMQKFYQRFLNKKSAQQALKETQDEFKNSKQWNDPFFWAPFVMIGI